RERRAIIEPLRSQSMCRIQRQRDEQGFPTLGVFRPFQIKRLIINKAEETEWSPEQQAILKQDTLFHKAPEQMLQKIPLEFRYEFRCGDVDCDGHTMLCTDWEMSEAYRRWR